MNRNAPITSCGAVVLAGGRSSRMGAAEGRCCRGAARPLLLSTSSNVLARCATTRSSSSARPARSSRRCTRRRPRRRPPRVRARRTARRPVRRPRRARGSSHRHRLPRRLRQPLPHRRPPAPAVRHPGSKNLASAASCPVDAPASGEPTDRHFPHPLASAVRVAPAHAAAARGARQRRPPPALHVRPPRRPLARRAPAARPPRPAHLQHARRSTTAALARGPRRLPGLTAPRVP